MNLEFKEITVEDSPVMLPYYNMRKNLCHMGRESPALADGI